MRALVVAGAAFVGVWGAWSWWRFRRQVNDRFGRIAELLRAILDELRR